MSKYPTSSRQYPYFTEEVGKKLSDQGWFFWWFNGTNITTNEALANGILLILRDGRLQANMYRIANPGKHQHRYCVVYRPVSPINYNK